MNTRISQFQQIAASTTASTIDGTYVEPFDAAVVVDALDMCSRRKQEKLLALPVNLTIRLAYKVTLGVL